MPLTDTQIRKAKPQAKPQKLFDGGGLFILITPTGGKLWRLKYRVWGTEKLLALGRYPEVTLADARDLRSEARKQLAQAIDPSAVKRAEKIKAKVQAADTFGALSDEWLEKRCNALAVSTVNKKKEILKNNLLPWLGTRPVKDITAPELLGFRFAEAIANGEGSVNERPRSNPRLPPSGRYCSKRSKPMIYVLCRLPVAGR